jgi:hypothetical protein
MHYANGQGPGKLLTGALEFNDEDRSGLNATTMYKSYARRRNVGYGRDPGVASTRTKDMASGLEVTRKPVSDPALLCFEITLTCLDAVSIFFRHGFLILAWEEALLTVGQHKKRVKFTCLWGRSIEFLS